MAISASALGSATVTAASSSLATSAAYTPTANALVLAGVTNSLGSSPPTLPTFSGNGLTWAEVATVLFRTVATPLARLTVFRAMGASPTNTTGTADFGGTNQTGIAVGVIELTGVDTSGTNGSGAVVQSPTSNGNASQPTGTLNAFADATNNAGVVFVAVGNNVAVTPDATATWNELFDINYATPDTAMECAWKSGQDTSIAIQSPTNQDWGLIALEIKMAVAGGATDVFFENRHAITWGVKPWTAAGMGGVLIG